MSRFKTPDHPKRRGIAISNYREFVNAGIHAKSPLGDAAGSILGDEGFRERVFKYLKIFPDKREIPEIKKIEKKYEIKDIVRSVADYYGVGEGDLLQRRKKTAEQRKVAVYLCKVLSGKKNVEVGHMFGITIQAVTNTIRFMEKIKEGGGKLDKEIMRIKEILTPGR